MYLQKGLQLLFEEAAVIQKRILRLHHLHRPAPRNCSRSPVQLQVMTLS